MANKQRVGIRGRGTMSKSLAGMDPRTHRNPQVTTRGEDYEDPLRVSRKTGRLGVNESSPFWDTVGSGLLEFRSVTTTTNLTMADGVLLCGGTISYSVFLPSARATTGKRFYVKNISATIGVSVSVTTVLSEVIDGVFSAQPLNLDQSVTLFSNGTGWWIL